MDLRFSCSHDGCSKAFKRRDRLEIHMRTHTGERPFICGVPGCLATYARSQHLSRHIENVHFQTNEPKTKVSCPHCEEELANNYCLRKHVKHCNLNNGQEQLYKYKCTEEGCEGAFRKKQQLVKHKLQHNDQLVTALKCYRCPHEGCDKKFSFPGRLKRHMKVHEGYPCDVAGCDEVSPNWSKLRTHKATAHCPTYTCGICGAVLKTKSNLTQHLKIHTSDYEPVSCTWEGCSRMFQYEKNLRQHIRSFHQGEKVFIKRPKLRRSKKRISIAAQLFGLDDRGKNLKVSRRNSKSKKTTGDKKSSTCVDDKSLNHKNDEDSIDSIETFSDKKIDKSKPDFLSSSSVRSPEEDMEHQSENIPANVFSL